MSKELVKKSLYKFLNDNLDYYVTYDSNNSNLKNITDLKVNTEIVYTAPTPITEIEVYNLGVKFVTLDDIIGRSFVIYESDGETILGQDVITGVDSITKAIEVQNGFTFDILPEYKMLILQENLIFIKPEFSMPIANARLNFFGHSERFDLIIKVRNDNDKNKVDTIVQAIRDLILSKYGIFDIYNSLNLLIGNGRFDIASYEEMPLMDMANDVQQFLVTFNVQYFMKYK